MDQSSEIVNLDGGNLERRFDNNINEALSEIKTAANEPIRKSSSTDIQAAANAFQPPSFSANAGSIGSKQSGFQTDKSSSSGNALSAAQQEFQAAMNSASQSTSDGLAAAKSASNEFAPAWGGDLKLPSGLTQSTNQVDKSFSAANQSLNRAQAGLGSAAQSANDFAAEARAKITPESRPFSGFASNNNFAPTGINTPDSSSAQPQDASRNGELELVQAQVAEAKQQIERLKMQVEDAKRKASAALPTGQSPIQQPLNSAPERVAQLEMPSFNSVYASPGSSGFQPANVLRSGNQPLLPQPPQSLVPQSPPGNFSPSYPATPHGGFQPRGDATSTSSNIAPQTSGAAAQAGFNSYLNQSNVMTAGSQPSAADSATRIQNYVSEVDIPDSVLKGTGSYAPGSVNALRR
jgi:hypothetical protein